MTDVLDQRGGMQMSTDQLWAVTTEIEQLPGADHSADEPADELWAPAGPSGRPPTPTTVLPRRPGPGSPPPVRRPIGQISRDDVLVLLGAVLSSISVTLLFFGRLLPLSGRLGFVVVWFAVFLAIYALLVSITDNRPAVVDRVMAALMTSSALIALAALLSVIIFTLAKGASALRKTNLYTEDMSSAGPLDPLSVGGISHAIVGTLIIMGIALLFTVPLSLACAVYLNETRGKITELVRSVVTAMTALPSIVAGLFIFATWVLILGFQRSGLAAALAISIMMLPIIIRSADVVLRLVPGNLREASAATGAPQWRTVWFVVLPTARSGLATSVILGVARGIGETAPVLLVSGITGSMNTNPRENPMMSLPLATFEFVRSPQPTLIARGFATAAVLMMLVLILFTIARILGGRPAGRLSKRQTRKAAHQSAKDLKRIEGVQDDLTSTSTVDTGPPPFLDLPGVNS
jgi:phosphate transport system permease protein